MLVAFELSGEHNTLPISEVLACLESFGVDFKPYLLLEGCLIIDIKSKDVLTRLSERLSMTHNIIKVICMAEEEKILDLIKSSEIEVKGTYVVRVRRIKGYSKVNTVLMERRIGKLLYQKGLRANLEHPNISFRLLLTENMGIFGYIIASVNRGAFEARKPQYKPFFYPGVLMPRVARALVNISKPGEYLLDPFCGTAGILVEAGLIGVKVIGGDVQKRLLLGAKINLDYYNVDYTLLYQDASKLSLKDNSIDSVVTDPPYGRSASIKAPSLECLITGSLEEIHRVLKQKRRAIFIFNRSIDDIIESIRFKILELHIQKVHRSLTRYIYVLEK